MMAIIVTLDFKYTVTLDFKYIVTLDINQSHLDINHSKAGY